MLSCPWRVERMPVIEDSNSVCLMMRVDEARFGDMRQAHLDIQFPEQIIKAACSRQIEFFAGRLLAKVAFMKLGCVQTFASVGNHREPMFPFCYTGNIIYVQNCSGKGRPEQ